MLINLSMYLESSVEQERSVSTVNPPLSLGIKGIKTTNRLRKLRLKGNNQLIQV